MSESPGINNGLAGREFTVHESQFDRLSTNLVALAQDSKRFVGAPRHMLPQDVINLLQNREEILAAVAARYSPGQGTRYDLAEGFLNVCMKLKAEAQVSGVSRGTRGVVAGDIELVNGFVRRRNPCR